MAKMFYSLEETAQKLAKSEPEVREMAKNGEITEFRDGDRLIFKVDQIESHGSDELGMSPLSVEESAFDLEPAATPSASGSSQGMSDFDNAFSLEDSGAGSGTGELAQDASGIAVFDADELEDADPAAQTQMTDGGIDGGLNLDQLGSGSGLMDLTRESDDTSLGAEGLLDELYPGEDTAPEETVASGDLFEGGPSVGDLEGDEDEAPVAVAAEPYDGKGSGLVGGLALGMIVASIVGGGVLLMHIAGMAPDFISELAFGPLTPGMVWAVIPAAVGLLVGGLGFAMGKAG
jgi:hypothetical protein